MSRILAGTLLAVVTTALVYAQGALSGTWQGESPGGSKIVFEVTATETTLKGTLTVDGQRLPVTDGKVAKNTLSFVVAPNGRPEPFSGELTKGQLRIWIERNGPAAAAVLTRIKN